MKQTEKTSAQIKVFNEYFRSAKHQWYIVDHWVLVTTFLGRAYTFHGNTPEQMKLICETYKAFYPEEFK